MHALLVVRHTGDWPTDLRQRQHILFFHPLNHFTLTEVSHVATAPNSSRGTDAYLLMHVQSISIEIRNLHIRNNRILITVHM